ncbi:MAG: hypothetical protein G01um101433_151 [Parcubacteria group bacterium Gr01-1014_33]|nr:MAG: hypothetical protein G01um101433_151 [Parcubacteria group bacterium Gr01-1014_33]
MNSISRLKNLQSVFTRSRAVNALYIIFMLIILSGTVLAAGFSLSFFLNQFNELFLASESGTSVVSSFDITGFGAIAPKLQIPLAEIMPPENKIPPANQ